MRNRIVGLFGIFVPMAVLGSLVSTARPCQKPSIPVAPTTTVRAARPDAPPVKKVDCAKAQVKKTGDVCKEPAGAV